MKPIDEYNYLRESVRRETPNRANVNMTLLSIFFVAGWRNRYSDLDAPLTMAVAGMLAGVELTEAKPKVI